METKVCTKCQCEKSLNEFNKCSINKDGHTFRCKVCIAEYKNKYNSEHRDSANEIAKKSYHKNKIKSNYASKKAIYYYENKDKILLKHSEYVSENKEKINKVKNDYVKNRRLVDPLYKLKCNIRTSIRSGFKANKHIKKCKTIEILGCTFDEFKMYLESKFEPWMNWENHGKYKKGEFNIGWDIDHIIPMSSANTEEEAIKLNHYTNFQPLCSKINRDIKYNKIL